MDLDKLKNRDYYFLIDTSGSMSDNDTPTGQTRYKYVEESATALARKLEEYDPDGITIVPFASSFRHYENTTSSKVKDVFKEHEPMGGTMLAGPLKWVFGDYLKNKAAGTNKANGAICVVITDGAPQDGTEAASAIKDFTHKLDNGDDEFGLSFIQVGKDGSATKYLKDLDDNLKGAKWDIVDAKTIDELEQIGIVEAVLASLTD